MNPDRLADLQRQRALVREQLAWLDREIATASAEAVGAPSPTANASIAPEFAALEETYRPDPVSAAAQMRRGCLSLAFAALLIGLVALTAIYFLRYRDRPLLFPAADNTSGTSKPPPSHK